MSEPSASTIPLALLIGEPEAGEHLRAALTRLGADVVYDVAPSALNSQALADSGAQAVLVNLDDEVEACLEEIYANLDENRYRVIFNDPEATRRLDGWDLARWCRHMADKISGVDDTAAAAAMPAASREPGQHDSEPQDENNPAMAPALSESSEENASGEVDEDWIGAALDVLGKSSDDNDGEAAGDGDGDGLGSAGELHEAGQLLERSDTPAEPPGEDQAAASPHDSPDLGLEAPDLDELTALLDDGLGAADTATPDADDAPDEARAQESAQASEPDDDGHDEHQWTEEFQDLEFHVSAPRPGKAALAQDQDREAQAVPSDAPETTSAAPEWTLQDFSAMADIGQQTGGGEEETGAAAFGVHKVDNARSLASQADIESGEDTEELTPGLELVPIEQMLAPQSGPVLARDVSIDRVVVLGASIGGPDAVREFLFALPKPFPATLILVQHLGEEFTELMIGQLAKRCPLPVCLPRQDLQTTLGEVLVVPSGQQLKLTRDGCVTLQPLPEGAAYNPSIDLTLSAVAEEFGEDAWAIIFSGMARDALNGVKDMAEQGGTVWAQDPASCVVSSMVDAACGAGVVSFTGTPTELAARLVQEFGLVERA